MIRVDLGWLSCKWSPPLLNEEQPFSFGRRGLFCNIQNQGHAARECGWIDIISHIISGLILVIYCGVTFLKFHNLQKLQGAITLIQSVPIKDRIPTAALRVKELIKLDQAMMVHKILNEQCPEILKQKFTKRSQVSKYEARRVNDPQVPRPRLKITRKSFPPRCGMMS